MQIKDGGEGSVVYLKIAIASLIIALSIPISIISAFIGEPWEHSSIIEIYYLFFCFIRNISVYMILLKVKTCLLFAAVYSVFVAVNLLFAVILSDVKCLTDIWNGVSISLWRGFWNTIITGMVLYILWIILLVVNEDKYFNNKDLQ